MQLRECEYVLTIAEEGNMSKAAQRLYVSQPTLSKMLNKLEESIGAPLFERQSGGMVPTRTGEAYLQGARRMMDLNAQWEQEILMASTHLENISVGLPMVRMPLLNYYAVPALAQRFPGVQTHYLYTSQGKLLVDLINNKCPLVVGIVPAKFANIINCDLVGEEEYILAVPKGHPLEAQAEPRPGLNYPHVDSALLRDVPFVLSRADAYSTRVARRFFQENGIRPPIALTVQNTSDVLPAVAKAIGVSLLPSLPLGALGVAHKVTYLHVKTSEGRLQIGVMYRRDYVLNAVESAFVGILRQAYQEG